MPRSPDSTRRPAGARHGACEERAGLESEFRASLLPPEVDVGNLTGTGAQGRLIRRKTSHPASSSASAFALAILAGLLERNMAH